MITVSPKIDAFARAIAKAEGFGIPDKVPTLAHNPGDLIIPGWTGPMLGEGISVFSSDEEGWMRLYHELALIGIGASYVYSLDMTINQMAAKWTATQVEEWAGNVSRELGVLPGTVIRGLLTEMQVS